MEVKTNKEYQAMQKEMSVAEHEIGDHETRMLERMEDADTLAAELKAAEAALKSEQAEIARERQALDAERDRPPPTRRPPRGAGRRRRAGEPGSAGHLRAHRPRPQGQAMAEAREGLCTVCHVRLRPQVFNEAAATTASFQCDSCTRILYYVPPSFRRPSRTDSLHS